MSKTWRFRGFVPENNQVVLLESLAWLCILLLPAKQNTFCKSRTSSVFSIHFNIFLLVHIRAGRPIKSGIQRSVIYGRIR